jgi:L-seryl-tRNA(Ser) seleniumtransferase
LLHYLKDEAEREVPVWRMIAMDEKKLRERALRWREALDTGEIIPGRSTVGGGSLPEETQPTCLLALTLPQPNRFLALLRNQIPPVIARVEDERVVLDPRTVLPEEEGALLASVRAALESTGKPKGRA